MNAKEFAEEARRLAKPNMIEIARIWMEGPASVEEWERDCVKMHKEQRHRGEEYYAREAARGENAISLTRA